MGNVYQLLRERSAKGDALFVGPDGARLHSYDDLEHATVRCASALTDLGARPGDRVMVQVEKSAQSLFLHFGCLRAGFIHLPLNTAYTEHELEHFITDAEPTVIVCDPTRAAFFKARTKATVTTLDAAGNGTLWDANTEPAYPVQAVGPDDTAVMLYTSGTTGRPKGAMITHRNLATNALTLHRQWQWREGDVMLHALPVFHVHGLFVATYLPLLNASPIILMPSFDANEVIDHLPHSTVYMGVPTHYVRLLATGRLSPDICHRMRLFTCGSAPLAPQTFTAFRDATGHEIVERYGMTETGMNTSNPLDGERKPGTVGPALPGIELKVVDERGEPVRQGDTGALCVRGDNVFRGYWQAPEKTAEEFDGEGYFRTGDLASVDAQGYVSIVGRAKDLIISGGLNVYPREVEDAICDIPGIVESAVVGLPHPDFGEGVCAIVVQAADAKLEAEDVIAALKGRMAGFKIPKWVRFTDRLPRNTMGKVQKNVLREAYAETDIAHP